MIKTTEEYIYVRYQLRTINHSEIVLDRVIDLIIDSNINHSMPKCQYLRQIALKIQFSVIIGKQQGNINSKELTLFYCKHECCCNSCTKGSQ